MVGFLTETGVRFKVHPMSRTRKCGNMENAKMENADIK